MLGVTADDGPRTMDRRPPTEVNEQSSKVVLHPQHQTTNYESLTAVFGPWSAVTSHCHPPSNIYQLLIVHGLSSAVCGR